MIQILSTQGRRIRRGFACGVCSVAVLIALTGSVNVAFAGDATFYARGVAYELNLSETELGVRLLSPSAADQVARDVGERGLGTLQRLEGDAFDSRYRILQVAAADTHTRDSAAELPNVVWVRPVYRMTGIEQPLLSTGKLVVRVVPNLGPVQVTQLWADHGVLAGTPIDGLANTYLVSAGDEVAAAEALHADARTVFAQPDFAAYSEPRQTTPLDVFFNQQWHLNNSGQGGGTAGADIGALDAWTVTLGENVNIGMLDDSCDIDHEDLRSNYLGMGQDIVDGDDDPRPTSIGDRHGTSVMGLAGAGARPNAFCVYSGILYSEVYEVLVRARRAIILNDSDILYTCRLYSYTYIQKNN